jgi:hypothetical protein
MPLTGLDFIKEVSFPIVTMISTMQFYLLVLPLIIGKSKTLGEHHGEKEVILDSLQEILAPFVKLLPTQKFETILF